MVSRPNLTFGNYLRQSLKNVSRYVEPYKNPKYYSAGQQCMMGICSKCGLTSELGRYQ